MADRALLLVAFLVALKPGMVRALVLAMVLAMVQAPHTATQRTRGAYGHTQCCARSAITQWCGMYCAVLCCTHQPVVVHPVVVHSSAAADIGHGWHYWQEHCWRACRLRGAAAAPRRLGGVAGTAAAASSAAARSAAAAAARSPLQVALTVGRILGRTDLPIGSCWATRASERRKTRVSMAWTIGRGEERKGEERQVRGLHLLDNPGA